MNLLPNRKSSLVPFDSGLNLLFNKKSEYSPLFTVNKFHLSDYVFENNFIAKHPKLKLNTYSRETGIVVNPMMYQNIIQNYNNIAFNTDILSNDMSLSSFLRVLKSKILNYVNDKTLNPFNKVLTSSHVKSYIGMFDEIKNQNNWQIVNLLNNRFLINFGFLSIYKVTENNNILFKPLFCFMVKSENVKHLRLCHLTNKDLKPELLELWIDKDFDSKDTEYKSLRIAYKQHLKPYLLENKIKIVEVDNLVDKIFTKIETPKTKTLKERSEWVNSVNKDFLEHENFLISLEEKFNINLVYE